MPNLKIISWLFISLIALIFGLLGWFLDVRRTNSNLVQSVLETSTRLDLEIERLQFFPEILANDLRVVHHLRDLRSEPAQAQRLLNLVKDQIGADRIFVLDRLGRVTLASPPDADFVGTSHRQRPFFEEAVSVEFGSFFGTDPLTQKPSYYLANQVLDLESGAFLGAVALQMDLDQRQSTWRPIGSEFLVVDEFSVVITSSISEHQFSAWRLFDKISQRISTTQRRYPVVISEAWQRDRNIGKFADSRFNLAEIGLTAEPWDLVALQSHAQAQLGHLYAAAFGLVLGLALVFGGAYFRQQRRFSRSLAQKVQEKSEELEAAQRALVSRETLTALGRISAAISHEVSQPIASLRFDIRTLQRSVKAKDQNRTQTILSNCRATLARAGRVLESLNLFARRHEAEKEAVELSHVLQEALGHVRAERPSSALNIHLIKPARGQSVWANELLLGQVLINLLTNALSATQDVLDPHIELSSLVKDATYHIYVEDNGLGLNEDQREQIFEPFRSTKPLGEGMGLGLHLSRTIVEDMGDKSISKRQRTDAGVALSYLSQNLRSNSPHATYSPSRRRSKPLGLYRAVPER